MVSRVYRGRRAAHTFRFTTIYVVYMKCVYICFQRVWDRSLVVICHSLLCARYISHLHSQSRGE